MKRIKKTVRKFFITLGILLGIGTLVSCYGVYIPDYHYHNIDKIELIEEDGSSYYLVTLADGTTFILTQEEFDEDPEYYSQFLVDSDSNIF